MLLLAHSILPSSILLWQCKVLRGRAGYAVPNSVYYQIKLFKYLMTFLFTRGLSLVLMAKLFTAVDLLRENYMKFVLL